MKTSNPRTDGHEAIPTTTDGSHIQTHHRQRTERVRCLECGDFEFRRTGGSPNSATTRSVHYECCACGSTRKFNSAYNQGITKTIQEQDAIDGDPTVTSMTVYNCDRWDARIRPLEEKLLRLTHKIVWIPLGTRRIDDQRVAEVYEPYVRWDSIRGSRREVWVVDDQYRL